MNLGHLRTLIHVAELGSLNKAARRLRVAQPALSRQIRLLEQELGVQLFRRHGHGMIVTSAGSRVVARAAIVLREIEELRAEANLHHTELHGQVAVGMPPTVADLMTVPLARAFHVAHPRVVLRFATAFSGHVLEWLQRGDVDVAVLYDPPPLASLRTQPLLLEELVVVGGPDSDLSLKRPVAFGSVVAEPLLLPSPRHGLRMHVERAAQGSGVQLNVPIEVDSLEHAEGVGARWHRNDDSAAGRRARRGARGQAQGRAAEGSRRCRAAWCWARRRIV